MAGVAPPHTDGRQNMDCTNCHDVIPAAGQRATPRARQQMMQQIAAPAGAVPPPIVAGVASPHTDGREKMACATCHTLLPAKAGAVAMQRGGAGASPYQFAQPPASLAMNVMGAGGTGAPVQAQAQAAPGPGSSLAVMGAYLQGMQPFLAQKLKQPAGRGVFVSGVVPDSPAFAAGLKAGDIILKVDGRPVKAAQEVATQLGSLASGKPVRLGILRDGEPGNLDFTPASMGRAAALPQPGLAGQQAMTAAPMAAQPAKPAVPTEFTWLGMEVESFQQVAAAAGAPKGTVLKGAAIAEIKPGSRAATNGLKMGDVILEVNNLPAGSAAQLDRAIKASAAGQPVLMKVNRNGQEFFVVI
jgi:membrane-associated protease RseP (regulator of RpoE activity)